MMTVAQAIELLRRFPQDAEVVATEGTEYDIDNYKSVIMVKAHGVWIQIDAPDESLGWLSKTA